MQNYALILGVFGDFEVNCLYLGFLVFLHKKCGMIFKSAVTLDMIQQQHRCYVVVCLLCIAISNAAFH